MLTPRRADLPTVRCDLCPDHPVLDTHDDRHDHQLCTRCQHRHLPVPHPEDHLCGPCRRECPHCHAPTAHGETCRACSGRCRSCHRPLPARPDPADDLRTVAPQGRRDRQKWTKTYFPRSWDRDLCDACRTPQDAARTVLAALPEPLLRACGGGLPREAVELVHAELRGHAPEQLVGRIDRRWWTSWAHYPLHAEGSASAHVEDEARHPPETILLWLLAPTACNGRCEDGWYRADAARPEEDDRPCPVCHGGRLLAAPRTSAHDGTHTTVASERTPTEERDLRAVADRPLSEALRQRPPQRECEGRDGACGRPVAPPHTRCPECLDWPRCACGRRRYDPERATACLLCTATAGS